MRNPFRPPPLVAADTYTASGSRCESTPVKFKDGVATEVCNRRHSAENMRAVPRIATSQELVCEPTNSQSGPAYFALFAGMHLRDSASRASPFNGS